MPFKRILYLIFSLFLFNSQLSGQKDTTIKTYKKLNLSFGSTILQSYGEPYFLLNLQLRYRYTPKKAIEIGLIKDIYRKPSGNTTRYIGFRNGYYISHQWVLNNPYNKTLLWFDTKLLYTQGDIAYDTPLFGWEDLYAPSAIYNTYDITYERRVLQKISIKAYAGLGFSFIYGSNINKYLLTFNTGICLGYNFLTNNK